MNRACHNPQTAQLALLGAFTVVAVLSIGKVIIATIMLAIVVQIVFGPLPNA